jgi:hypothetical protein
LSKPKFKVQNGLAFVITTGEPVYVINIDNGKADVVRPVTGDHGTSHVYEAFPLDQLETRHEQIKRNMEYAEYAEGLKIEMDNRLTSMAEGLFSPSNKPSKPQMLPFNRTDS